MANRGLRPALWLSAWTLAVWTTRIRNIWTDDALSLAGQVGRTALALAFTVLACGTIAAWWRGRRTEGTAPSASRWVRALAAWTIGVWAIRAVQIGLADHSVVFVAVHTTLAVVSIALAVVAEAAMRRSVTPSTDGRPGAHRAPASGSGTHLQP